MARQKKIETRDKIYMVVTEAENKYFSTFVEAESVAKDYCEENDENVEIYEIHKAWNVYYPVEPEPESNEISIAELIE